MTTFDQAIMVNDTSEFAVVRDYTAVETAEGMIDSADHYQTASQAVGVV